MSETGEDDHPLAGARHLMQTNPPNLTSVPESLATNCDTREAGFQAATGACWLGKPLARLRT